MKSDGIGKVSETEDLAFCRVSGGRCRHFAPMRLRRSFCQSNFHPSVLRTSTAWSILSSGTRMKSVDLIIVNIVALSRPEIAPSASFNYSHHVLTAKTGIPASIKGVVKLQSTPVRPKSMGPLILMHLQRGQSSSINSGFAVAMSRTIDTSSSLQVIEASPLSSEFLLSNSKTWAGSG